MSSQHRPMGAKGNRPRPDPATARCLTSAQASAETGRFRAIPADSAADTIDLEPHLAASLAALDAVEPDYTGDPMPPSLLPLLRKVALIYFGCDRHGAANAIEMPSLTEACNVMGCQLIHLAEDVECAEVQTLDHEIRCGLFGVMTEVISRLGVLVSRLTGAADRRLEECLDIRVIGGGNKP